MARQRHSKISSSLVLALPLPLKHPVLSPNLGDTARQIPKPTSNSHPHPHPPLATLPKHYHQRFEIMQSCVAFSAKSSFVTSSFCFKPPTITAEPQPRRSCSASPSVPRGFDDNLHETIEANPLESRDTCLRYTDSALEARCIFIPGVTGGQKSDDGSSGLPSCVHESSNFDGPRQTTLGAPFQGSLRR